MKINKNTLTHLQQLEAEAIHILREVTAEFSNPVMMYSVGKDSSVMLYLATKAFAPGKIPFLLFHVDTLFSLTMERDTAAADAIVRESGKMVYDKENKQQLLYNKNILLNPWFIVR